MNSPSNDDLPNKLHAQKKKRNVVITIVWASIILHGLLLFIASLVILVNEYIDEKEDEEEPYVTIAPGIKTIKVRTQKQAKMQQIMQQSAAPRPSHIVVHNPNSIPLHQVEIPGFKSESNFNGHVSGDFGLIKVSSGGENIDLGGIPGGMRHRCSKANRQAKLKANGGNEQCEAAVMKSLRWLKKTQNADGSWTSNNQAAMTGFAVLAFLGHCETPHSKEFGDAVRRGINYLIKVGMNNAGRITTSGVKSTDWVYEHAIATYALAEAYIFCSGMNIKIPKHDIVTKEAGNIIMRGQGQNGGWGSLAECRRRAAPCSRVRSPAPRCRGALHDAPTTGS